MSLLCFLCSRAQTIDSLEVGQLRLNIDATGFFQNNEFDTPLAKGYTLPGFRLQPTVQYCPNEYVKIEGGVNALRFWGTDSYPNLAYTDIAEWTGGDNTAAGFHLMPVLRMQMATKHGLNVVLGTIYGGGFHKLIEPLYTPELDFTADPETGAQIFWRTKPVDFDIWVNWQSFIYRTDTHLEAFTFGVSSRVKYTPESAKLHLYSPVQALFQHRGGEIDTIVTNSVKTTFNGAVGFGARFCVGHKWLRSVAVEADALIYKQPVGDLYPYDSGHAWWLHADARVWNTDVKAGLFAADKFVSMFGYPFFGTVGTRPPVSNASPAPIAGKSSMLVFGADYSREFAPGCTLGVNAEVFRHLPMSCGGIDYKAKTSFTAALFMRINPSFILKRFK